MTRQKIFIGLFAAGVALATIISCILAWKPFAAVDMVPAFQVAAWETVAGHGVLWACGAGLVLIGYLVGRLDRLEARLASVKRELTETRERLSSQSGAKPPEDVSFKIGK